MVLEAFAVIGMSTGRLNDCPLAGDVIATVGGAATVTVTVAELATLPCTSVTVAFTVY
jgi:hypothetical protein